MQAVCVPVAQNKETNLPSSGCTARRSHSYLPSPRQDYQCYFHQPLGSTYILSASNLTNPMRVFSGLKRAQLPICTKSQIDPGIRIHAAACRRPSPWPTRAEAMPSSRQRGSCTSASRALEKPHSHEMPLACFCSKDGLWGQFFS